MISRPDSTERPEPLLLRGSPRARGRAHGEALREPIRRLFAAWEAEVHREVGLDLRSYLDRFYRETSFLPALQRHTPGLLEEVRGLAEGANTSFEKTCCLQFMDEHWHHLEGLQARMKAGGDKCSSLGRARQPGLPTCLGQNMDLPKYLDGFQTLLQISYPEWDLELLVPSYAGFIGLLGVNNRGIGVCVNTLAQLRAAPVGLPVAFVIRSLLERTTLEAAVAHLREVPHAAGQNYLVGSPDGLVDLECSAGGAVRYLPPSQDAPICHTNHPLASRDLGEQHTGWDADRQQADIDHGRTFSRLSALEHALAGPTAEPMTAERLKAILSTRTGYLCRLLDGPFTVFAFCSAVLTLDDRPTLHLSMGPPAVKPYHAYRFG